MSARGSGDEPYPKQAAFGRGMLNYGGLLLMRGIDCYRHKTVERMLCDIDGFSIYYAPQFCFLLVAPLFLNLELQIGKFYLCQRIQKLEI